ncbi:MAG: Hsp70 family protein [Gammaproteobacteria bacterium]|nr:Hsp70 family protein [Gammaproteobacteria bacterium]
MSNQSTPPALLAAHGAAVPPRPIRVVGIDLGTTNSSISEILLDPAEPGLPDPRPVEVEQATTQGPFTSIHVPSMVALCGGVEYIGEGARILRPQPARHGLKPNRDLFWDCKNEIGTRRTYHHAPEGYRSAREIGGKLLRFLFAAAKEQRPAPIDSAVVAIPASFQLAQRKDTLEAARLAGLTMLDGGCLLDEPTAAFIAYLASGGGAKNLESGNNLLVFDFGGGTCDVAVFKLLATDPGQPADIAPLAVSRYCRLGGGDIDRAIIIESLLPQLIEHNGLNGNDLDFDDKQAHVIPSLLAVAESLKVGLCREITRMRALGRKPAKLAALAQTLSGAYPCRLRSGKELQLHSPKLKATELNRALEPFLDKDTLHPREGEYVMTCSIFAPLKDAVERAGLAPADIDYCLLVGGSSLIPPVSDAIGGFFPKAETLRFNNTEEMLSAVSRGAALQALSLALNRRGIFRTVTGSSVSLRTKTGSKVLLDAGVELPFPASGSMETSDLTVPETALLETVPLRIELCDAEDRTLYAQQWDIEPPVNRGDPLLLTYRMDANQVFHLELSLAEDRGRIFRGAMENPLTHVVNPNSLRDQVLELEEQMRTGNLSATEKQHTVLRIAELEESLGRYEHALSLLRNLARHSPDANLLHRMALVCGRMRDFGREEKYYLESVNLNRKSGDAYFNLSLSKRGQGKNHEAADYADKAIATEDKPPYRVLKALIADKLRDAAERRSQLVLAFNSFDPIPLLSDWELHWLAQAAKLAGKDTLARECETEKSKRNRDETSEAEGLLPELAKGTGVVVVK